MKKNVACILFTITVMVAVCYYLYSMNAAYDGGLISSLVPFVFTVPLIAGVDLWRILTGKTQAPSKQKLWQKIVCSLLYIVAIAIMIYYLIDSKFYDLSCIILLILLIALAPYIYCDYKKSGKVFNSSVLNWAVTINSFYILTFSIVFAYIQIISPITVEQATNIVAEQYGENPYEFVGHLDFHNGYNHLGVYWFSQTNTNQKTWLEVDLLTGDLNEF